MELVEGSYEVSNGQPSLERGALVGRCWMSQTDRIGGKWTAQGSSWPHIRISCRDGQWTNAKFGPPFKARLIAQARGPYRPGQEINFEAKVTGVDGKNYQFSYNGQRQPPPRMMIRDESGRQLGTYAFQYG